MKLTVIPFGLMGIFLLLAWTGCSSMDVGSGKHRGNTALSEEEEKSRLSAEALAQYSLGLIEKEGGNSDKHFARLREAVKLDSGNVALKMELALAYFHGNKQDELDSLLDEILRDNPQFVRAYQLKALSLQVRGKGEEALKPLGDAIKLEPGETLNYLEVANIHLRGGNIHRAIEVLEHSLADVKDRQATFHALGELYLRQADRKDKKNFKPPKAPLEMMRLAAQEFPQDPYLLNLYGDLLILHQKMEDAIEVFSQIEALNPSDLELRQKLALSLVAVGNREKAILILEDVAQKKPTNHRLWYYLAELYEQDQNIDKAIECYRQAISLRPTEPVSYIRQAYLLLVSKKPDEAKAVLEAGFKYIPDDLRLVEMLAYVYMEQDEYQKAYDLYSSVEKNLSGTITAATRFNFFMNYAIASQMTGNEQEAIRILRATAENNPEIIEDYLALTLRDRGNKARLTSTLSVLESMQELIPGDPSTLTLYGLVAFNAEEYAAALSLYERAESLMKESGREEELTAQLYFWMGASAERIKQYDKSESYFLGAIHLEPDHADSHNYLAYMHAERGVKLDMAFDHVNMALAIEPENPAYLDTRGWIYFQQGKFEDALSDIKAAADKMPGDATISDHLGDVYLALGDEAHAIDWWRYSYAADQSNATVADKLNSRGVDLNAVTPATESDPESSEKAATPN